MGTPVPSATAAWSRPLFPSSAHMQLGKRRAFQEGHGWQPNSGATGKGGRCWQRLGPRGRSWGGHMGEGTSHALGCALGGTWPGAQGPIRVVRTEARLRAVGREQVSRSRTASRALGGGGGQMQKPRAYGAGRGHWAALCSVELVVLCLVDGGLSRSGPCPEAARGSVALTRSFDARGLQAPHPLPCVFPEHPRPPLQSSAGAVQVPAGL